MKENTTITAPPFALNDVSVAFETHDERIFRRLLRQWRPFQKEEASPLQRLPPIFVTINAVSNPPQPPAFPVVSRGSTAVYYREEDQVVAYFKNWGRYDIDLALGTVVGYITQQCLQTYGVFEDMIIIALAPLLRRRGLYTIHAFAASIGEQAIVIIGDIGTGKTTTGISLLCQGAKFIANDSPLLKLQDGCISIGAYPGLLSTFPETLAWFPEMEGVIKSAEKLDGSAKVSFAVDDVWSHAWQMKAYPAILVYPKVETGTKKSQLKPLPRFQALQRLVDQSIESWDISTIPDHLRALRLLVDAAPAYELYLAPDVDRIPRIISEKIS